MPNVSFCEDTPNEVHYNPYVPPFFCKLTLNDGSIVNIEDTVGNGELTSAMTSPYSASCVSAKIGELCTSIGDVAFVNCTSLASITIPSSVKTIGANPSIIAGCSNLKEITFDASCPVPRGLCTYGTPNIQKVSIGDSVTSIGYRAFSSNSSLTSVTIGNSIESIGEQAFNGCSSLSSVTVEATTPPTLGSDAFINNASGRKIYVPSESVNTYQTTSGWSTYASDILPIQ